ncbi:hypoxanthine phosphoribosyltransferase [bacterium]|nr:hypoxanthine phosphoribosyltransferase [bacterium]MCI0603910.1 hypoxanthine phosphoribosyltransferase [bacterium]
MFKAEVLLTEEQIQHRVRELADKINSDYEGVTVDILCILKGSLVFAADLIRRLTVPLRIQFMQVQSYTGGTHSSGTVYLHFSSDFELKHCDVLLLEDILDTGVTLEFLQEHLKQMDLKSLKTCVLLDKPARRKVNIRPDYVGFEIEDHFVVGYGLDYKEFGRNLPYIGILSEVKS